MNNNNFHPSSVRYCYVNDDDDDNDNDNGDC